MFINKKYLISNHKINSLKFFKNDYDELEINE